MPLLRPLSCMVLALMLVGCATPSVSNPSPARLGIKTPAGFNPIPSRVPKVEWKRVFFRVARDIRLLPRLHRHVYDIKVTLLTDKDERTFLFIAHARLTHKTDENFWKIESHRLYQPEMKPDFVQIRHYPNRSLTESEAYLRGEHVAKTVIAISDDRHGNVHLVGGSRLIGGDEPFVLDQIVARMVNDLNR